MLLLHYNDKRKVWRKQQIEYIINVAGCEMDTVMDQSLRDLCIILWIILWVSTILSRSTVTDHFNALQAVSIRRYHCYNHYIQHVRNNVLLEEMLLTFKSSPAVCLASGFFCKHLVKKSDRLLDL